LIIRVATPEDKKYSAIICEEIASSAKARGTGIATRTPEYIEQKIDEGKAVIAVTDEGEWVGFCYIETWSHGEYVANSGLIVAPAFRKSGVAKSIKQKIFNLSREKYPDAKIFGLTTGLAVMKINSGNHPTMNRQDSLKRYATVSSRHCRRFTPSGFSVAKIQSSYSSN